MKEPKRRYTNAGGMTKGLHLNEWTDYWSAPDSELVSVKCASMVLNVRLQAVVKLGLPRYLVEKRAVYRKEDIQALLLADRDEPNKLLRDLQEQHREAQIKQKAHPSRRYKRRPDLLPAEAKAAKEATKANRKPPPKEKRPHDPWAYFKRLRELTGT